MLCLMQGSYKVFINLHCFWCALSVLSVISSLEFYSGVRVKGW
jgi:hypothetical protein